LGPVALGAGVGGRGPAVGAEVDDGGDATTPAATATNAATHPATNPATPPGAADDVLLVAATPEAGVGDTVSVTLANRSGRAVQGELGFDPSRLAATTAAASPGRVPFSAAARGDAVVVLRVLPAAAGGQVSISVDGLHGPGGEPVTLRVQGQALVQVAAPLPAPNPAEAPR
jgi:hypothetical protein